MGLFVCCKKESNIFERAKDQSSLNEAISREIEYLNEVLKEKTKDNNMILKTQDIQIYNPSLTKSIKGAVRNIEDHFYLLSLIIFLEEIEKRFRTQNFKQFHEIKSKFIKLYKFVNNDSDYNSLFEEMNKFNHYLDNEKVDNQS
jgi:hypothetical protein